MYHGSNSIIKGNITPYQSKIMEGERVIFATPNFDLSVIFIPKWSDEDLDLGRMEGEPLFEVKERYKGAFEKLKISGYVYTLRSDNFKKDDGLGMSEEFVSFHEEDVLCIDEIHNVYEYIKGKKECFLLTHFS